MRIAVIFTERQDMPSLYKKDWEGRDKNQDKDSVIKSLKTLGHKVVSYPADVQLFETLRKNKKDINLIFNLCDDGFLSNAKFEPHIPAMLDLIGIDYTGGDYLSLALTSDKGIAKKLLAYHKLSTPEFQIFEHSNENNEKTKLRFPLIVKPSREDASIGIKDDSVVKNELELKKMIETIITDYNQPALVEEFIQGREFNVAVIGNSEVLPISEISFNLPEGKPNIVNYNAKWKKSSVDYKGTKRICPADIVKELERKLTCMALKAGSIFGCRDYYRVDFRVDKENNPYILEINQNPDISEDAGLAAMAKAKGYLYRELIAKILESACRRKNGNKD